jgi:hypothetical protein
MTETTSTTPLADALADGTIDEVRVTDPAGQVIFDSTTDIDPAPEA